jgi:hypothetical protein
MLIQQFGLRVREQTGYFAGAPLGVVSARLRENLADGLPLASAIGTEKARSEFVIAPVLDEIRRQCAGQVSLFSGVDFTVDLERGLRGVCDFLFSLSPLQSTVQAPVIAIVEAKNENLKSGLGQCAAEMLAAQMFNAQRGNTLPAVFGVVTTGSDWKFLSLTGDELVLDLTEYQISQPERILGILLSMVRPTPVHSLTDTPKIV